VGWAGGRVVLNHCCYFDSGGSARQREEDSRRPDGVKTHYHSRRMENSNWTRPHREKEKHRQGERRGRKKSQGQRTRVEHYKDKEIKFSICL